MTKQTLSSMFSWRALRSLLKGDNYARGSHLQERADVLKLYLLTGAREVWPKVVPAPDVNDLPTSAEQRAIAFERVRLQTLTLLDAWRVERPPPLPLESPTAPVAEDERAAAMAEHAAAVAAAQRRAFGFELHLAPSTAGASAGMGVFVSGRAPPGTVLATYPGVSYEPADMLLLPGGTKHFRGNEYLMGRYDKTIIDASTRALKLLPDDALSCPLALGHRVNHPPRGTSPNIMPAPIDWDTRTPADLVQFLPQVSFEHISAVQRQLLLDDGSGSREQRRRTISDMFVSAIAESSRPAVPDLGPVLKGLVLVAARPLEDEEVFLNYRFNPRNGSPDWYVPVDLEEDKRRWTH